MVTVEVCIGSACYVRGSNHVVSDLKELIKEEHWEEKVALKGSFCMKACQNHIGLGVKINGRQIAGVTMQNAREILKEEISKALA
ncbi:MAG: NAD(P)H-dependent oxidoreductase subunit E [Solobacterium sp.]|jgi:NADH-quinone oxidoreductase subunit G|nr:NAD(P)H-dependent oxidoreductase subunit E [Solobacterium sp.]MCH4222816.1 NAD(P)H-dependent oxidoreductase subunit E [Solobacterium sp.]MCH4266287.1 NAD(P)H-dependent oxidoreductase subunit E [Solobacterium sp.]